MNNNNLSKVLNKFTQTDKAEFYNVFLSNPRLIADLEAAHSFLLSNIANDIKCEILCSIESMINSEKHSREHTKGYKKDLKKVYNAWSYNKYLSFSEFVVLYRSIKKIEVIPYAPTSLTSKQINLVNTITNDDEIKYEIILDLLEQINNKQIDIQIIADKYFSKNESSDRLNYILNFYKEIKKDVGNILSVILDLTTDINNNDITVENKVIYDILKENMNNYLDTTLFVIFPNVEFVKKLSNDAFYSGTRIVFVFDNKQVANICSRTIKKENNSYIFFEDINNYLPYAKIDNISIMMFGNRIFSDDNSINSIKSVLWSNSKTVKLLIDCNADNVIKKNIITKSKMNEHIKSIRYLPYGVKNETVPKKKTVIEYTATKPNGIELYHYSLETIDDKQYIVENPSIHIANVSELNKNEGLRSLYNNKETANLKKTNNTRKLANRYSLSRHVDVNYTIDKNGKVEAYIKNPYTGRSIKNSSKEYNSKSYEDALNWIKNNYMFEKKKSGGKLLLILDVLSEELSDYLDNKELDFCSLIIKCPDFYYSQNKKKKEVIKQIMLTDLGYLLIDKCKTETIISVLNSQVSEDEQYDIISMLSELTDSAIKEGLVYENMIKKQLDDIRINTGKKQEMRKALAKRSFTIEEYRKAYNICLDKINKGLYEYIGVLLKLFLPLDYDQICAITVEDIKTPETFNDNNEVYYINIYKRIAINDNNSLRYERLKTSEQYRKVVIPSIISNIINNHIKHIKENMPEQNDISFLSGYKVDDVERKITPEKLIELCKSVLKEMKINKDIIKMFDKDINDNIENDLSLYSGDLFKSNLKYYVLSEDMCNFSVNEANYYFGYKQSTTHAKNYVDYETDGSLLKQHIKLKRIESLIKSDSTLECINKETYDNGEILLYRNGKSNWRYITILDIYKTDNDIYLSNKYGFDLTVCGGDIDGKV